MYTQLTPRLVVADVEAAMRFYAATLDAVPGMVVRAPGGMVVHAEMEVAGLKLSLTEAGGGPDALGGSPVLLQLQCDDPDGIQERFVKEGGSVVFPVADHGYGARDGRLKDIAGHLWLVTRTLEELDEAELQRRMDAM